MESLDSTGADPGRSIWKVLTKKNNTFLSVQTVKRDIYMDDRLMDRKLRLFGDHESSTNHNQVHIQHGHRLATEPSQGQVNKPPL